MRENFHDDNNVNIMVQSGARGNWMQIRQIAGMRGLVANPKGEIIPRPVKSNYRGGPYSRLLAADVVDPADGQTVLYHAGDALSMDVLNDLVAHGVEEVKGRSVLTCESKRGVCSRPT